MPSISYDTLTAWSNYHLTIGNNGKDGAAPHLSVRDLGRFHAADLSGEDGLGRFAATAATLFGHLGRAATLAASGFPGPPLEPRVGIVGRGWSFTPLIGCAFSQLMCDGLSGTGMLAEADRHADCSVPGSAIALTSGGTRLRELVNWAKPRGKMVESSGTHLGPSIAGSIATASHGSRMDYGGIQNSILGLHLVVAPGEHVWLDRASDPLLSEDGLARLTSDGKPVRLVRSDDHFNNALVHLGAMGIVNGVALRLASDQSFAPLRVRRRIDTDFLEEIGAGAFGTVAWIIGCNHAPFFYELTIDPFRPFDKPALHNFYFKTCQPPDRQATAEGLSPGDIFARSTAAFTAQAALLERKGSGDPGSDELDRALQLMLKGANSAFDRYAIDGGFNELAGTFDPHGAGVQTLCWDQLHPDEITGGFAGALYNASFAIPRERTAAAVEAITKSVAGLPQSFVFTLRFVSQPAGTLAFTRFEENTVIEIDGLSPLVCHMFAEIADAQESSIPDGRAFRELATAVPRGAAAVRAALDGQRIPYSMHWAKLGDLDRAKVQADMGGSVHGEASLIEKWRMTREELIPEPWLPYFRNDEIVRLGLV